MKKLIKTVLVVLLALGVFAGCKKQKDEMVLVVGATPEPHAAILALLVDDLAEEGITLQIREFTDYSTPNEAVESGEIDANFFQHIPYQNSFNSERGYHLVDVASVHIEPLALYSKKYTSLEDIPSGAVIAVPNDPTNEGRALLLLESAGLITLNPDAGLTATPIDITENAKNFRFREIEAASLPRVLADVDAAIINGNYALPAGLTAARDGLLVEGSDSPYVNVVTVKAGSEDKPKIKALVKAILSPEVKEYILLSYPDGDVIPVF
ncbi:MetQ/NlpA family ABC transporter substrate-binding protein [Brucepastera parasyntrophica]|uniref:MetQ/NlpA family ABC transporter substrate-binding protein n=1 Tax=Brucepastera parasyntrophica TaxID=2880008 RepID=UPI00210E6A23|nr:MetQ/NlpA family ABC transporter substrate-binding protein [Brucepastera parasyntrophica]ULQ58929.1 MetQ/NlpA family ABC transporter substrate-binding protein [Brucepastera parasyntrophica]